MNLLRKISSVAVLYLIDNYGIAQADTASVGGDVDLCIEETALFSEEDRNLRLWTVNDSLANIPAYDLYCHFDTRTLFPEKTARETIDGSTEMVLCYESCDFVYPVTGPLNSDFGHRWGRMHYGIDIDLETGDPVAAAFEGMIRISQNHPTYGNVVVIRHPNGLETLYAHLSKLEVHPGDYIQAGEIIGLGGSTGRSTGPHLHFEVRYMGDPINPNELVDAKLCTLRDWSLELTDSDFDMPVAPVASKSVSQKKYHTVKSGETLTGIAIKHKTTVTNLCKLNRIGRNSIIRPGQRLRYK
ncbi:MAG: peptidoglycan DD-metalloendopeptidase family protein [Flavobacteriales bacterium]|nr:peptidoglycan DD-metalloendopeptidase family protein [Flavobacteriales bacterium]